jgi:hypothetical protein
VLCNQDLTSYPRVLVMSSENTSDSLCLHQVSHYWPLLKKRSVHIVRVIKSHDFLPGENLVSLSHYLFLVDGGDGEPIMNDLIKVRMI